LFVLLYGDWEKVFVAQSSVCICRGFAAGRARDDKERYWITVELEFSLFHPIIALVYSLPFLPEQLLAKRLFDWIHSASELVSGEYFGLFGPESRFEEREYKQWSRVALLSTVFFSVPKLCQLNFY
jgi:hypothetical protein